MQADIFNLPVEAMAHDEGPALGAALLAGVAGGVYRDVNEAGDRTIRIGEVIEPDPERTARYGQLLHAFRALYPATQAVRAVPEPSLTIGFGRPVPGRSR
jgi:xylulokinase